MSVKIEVIRVDKDTLKHFKYPLFVPYPVSVKFNSSWTDNDMDDQILESLKKGCNVGDFIIFPATIWKTDQMKKKKVFRRIRGGFREANDEDMAELIATQL